MEPIIKVDNVSMCFNLSTEKHESLKEYLLAMVQGRLQYDEFYALRDVSLDIMPGDFYGLVGLNGSGKSTLLKTIAGVYKPTKGKVTVNGTIAPSTYPFNACFPLFYHTFPGISSLPRLCGKPFFRFRNSEKMLTFPREYVIYNLTV